MNKGQRGLGADMGGGELRVGAVGQCPLLSPVAGAEGEGVVPW